jgi:hypothetical protein
MTVTTYVKWIRNMTRTKFYESYHEHDINLYNFMKLNREHVFERGSQWTHYLQAYFCGIL